MSAAPVSPRSSGNPNVFYPGSPMNARHASPPPNSDGIVYTPSVIMLTGGAGFIGSNVVIELMRAHPTYKMIVLDKLDVCASVANLDEVKNNPNFQLVIGDIGDAPLVRSILVDNKVDTIMHFAAQTHVDNSFGNSIHFTDSNIRGTHLLLECVKSVAPQIKRFIHVSTDEVYGEGDVSSDQRLDEQSPLNPTNPYAATKCAAEFLVKSYAISFGIPAIITRGNNVFGPHQFPEKVIPKFISLLSLNKPCPLHGSGEHRRSFLYVTDVARAFDIILHKGENSHIYNIGSSEELEISNHQLLIKLISLFRQRHPELLNSNKKDEDYITFVADRAFNDQRYHIDSSSLYKLGWMREKSNLDQQLIETIEWYLSHPNHWPQQVLQGALVAHPHMKPTQRKSSIVKDNEAVQDIPVPTEIVSPSNGHGHVNGVNGHSHMNGNGHVSGLKWLVYGANGWIGGQVCSLIESRPGDILYRSSARANDISGVEAEIMKVRPDRILSLIGRTYGPGYTTIDYLEQKGKLVENVNDNLYAPLVLATLAKKHSIHFTYMGTGCIFTYDEKIGRPVPEHGAHNETDDSHNKNNNIDTKAVVSEADSLGFSESDKPNFFASGYSTVKGFTDQLMALQFGDSTLNIRIRMPITACSSGRNFITKITNYAKICSISNSMTVLPELLPIMLNMAAAQKVGTVNLTNPGYISHNEILSMYRDIVDPSFTWKNFTVEQQNEILAAGRSNNALATKVLQEFAPNVKNIHQSVKDLMYQMKENRKNTIHIA